MPTFSAQSLRRTAQAILEAVGTPTDSALSVSDALVEANLVGHDSHGVMRLMQYVEFVHRGQVKPAARPVVVTRHGATAQVDGAWGWGQPAATLATGTAIELAAALGVGAVTITRGNHIGRLGAYVETIAQAGMIGIALCNADPAVAPYGGRARIMGTNPLAWAAPRGPGQAPLVLDFATASVAEGKLRLARAKGETIAPGLIVDADGRPSQNPADFYAGGALLPFGEHKGYGISLMIELIGRGLAGMDFTALPEYRGSNGVLLLALGIAAFAPIEQVAATSERLCEQIKESPTAEGFSEIMLPGELESQTRRRRLVEGIALPEQTSREIAALAEELHVSL